MNQEQLNRLVTQLRQAADILSDSDALPVAKVSAINAVGAICSFHGTRWGDELYGKVVDKMAE